MRFIIDQDYHIHTHLSPCSGDPLQTPGQIVSDAREAGLHSLCLTDHYWDELVEGGRDFYEQQTYSKLASLLPLPQSDDIRFYFGCETEVDMHYRVGIGKIRYDAFEFINIPLTHYHFVDLTIAKEDKDSLELMAKYWVKRFEAVLSSDLPFYKAGLAHLTDVLTARSGGQWIDHVAMLDMIPDSELHRLFAGAAEKGIGIELNFTTERYTGDQLDRVLRVYRSAKDEGCRFYFGSDRHIHGSYEWLIGQWNIIIDKLGLEESDKYHIGTKY